MGFELPTKTLGVIGLGQIGVKVANAAHDLGMNVIGYDPLITVDNAINLQPGVQNVKELKELLNKSDIITIHIPHKKETENFIGENEIKQLNDGAIIINLSREAIVDSIAVLNVSATSTIPMAATMSPHSIIVTLNTVAAPTATHAMNVWIAKLCCVRKAR